MSLAIFDLDNTLLAGDSDYLWGRFLLEKGLVDQAYDEKNKNYYRQYEAGDLNIYEFLEFQLGFLAQHTTQQLITWRSQYLEEKIQPIILQKALELINRHKEKQDTLLIITATNNFITRPIADMLNVENLLATEAEIKNERYTGNVKGVPCFQQGKITRLNSWLENHQLTLEGSFFYSDSHNDIPLLETVDFPCAVNPDSTLKQVAESNHWPILDLRDA